MKSLDEFGHPRNSEFSSEPDSETSSEPDCPDYVDGITIQWSRERPDLDIWPMDIIGRIRRLTSVLNKANEEVWSELELQSGHFDVLAALRRAGPPYRLSPTELYNSLLISSGAMTHRLARMTSDGLIKRVPDSKDGRSLLVELTERGHEVIDESVEAFLMWGYEILQCLTEQEREQITSILRKLLVSHGDTGMPELSKVDSSAEPLVSAHSEHEDKP